MEAREHIGQVLDWLDGRSEGVVCWRCAGSAHGAFVMFGYESVAQLASDIRAKLHAVPRDIDLVVGIPRSGMIPAYLIGLYINRSVVDLGTFLANGSALHGHWRVVGVEVPELWGAKHVLLVDDSVSSGASMRDCVQRVHATPFAGQLTTCAAIVEPSMVSAVDLHFREMPMPRIFEWNMFHHPDIKNSCFDLDGILCIDPSALENDDGPRYREFLRGARPRFAPTQRIGHIVSARLERYRGLTEEWLTRHGIRYGMLHLLDLPNQAERVRLGAHASHKANVYQRTGAGLFYESDPQQAQEIARQSGKPVICTDDMQLYLPTRLGLTSGVAHAKWRLKTPLGRLKGWLRRPRMFGLPGRSE